MTSMAIGLSLDTDNTEERLKAKEYFDYLD